MSKIVFKESPRKDVRLSWTRWAFFLSLVLGVWMAGASFALAAEAGSGDLAADWLRFLFQGPMFLASDTDALTALTVAFRRALDVYGKSVFVIAGFLLLWNLVSMTAETAQSGVFMGTKANKLWAPIRFALGIALLIPLGNGLVLGQHVIVTAILQGSSLASTAWREGIDAFGERFSAPVFPHDPGVGRLMSASMEMALCRGFYHTLFTVYQEDPIIALAGDMTGFSPKEADALRGETWRYTNAFFSDEALCGGYGFLSSSTPNLSGQDLEDSSAFSIAQSARALAEKMAYQTRGVADPIVTAFFPSARKDEESSSLPDMQGALASLFAEQSQSMLAARRTLAAQTEKKLAVNVVQEAQTRGWIMAGAFPFDVARRQLMMGEMLGYALPTISPPLVGHDVLNRTLWREKATERLGVPADVKLGAYDKMFDQLSFAMKKARPWLYNQMKPINVAVLPGQQDVRDALGPLSEADAARESLARLVTEGARAFGVFSYEISDGRTYLAKPIQTIAETGRRTMAYGGWLFGLLSPALTQPATLGVALFFLVVAGALWLAGAFLVFGVPLVPLFRVAGATLGWGVAVMGAVLALPIVALGHFYPSGEGLVGPIARKAYWLWLSLFLRPAFILAGFVGGLALFLLGTMFLNTLVFDWLAPISVPQSQIFWIFRSGVVLFYAAGVWALVVVSFRGVSTFSDLLTQWIDARSSAAEAVVAMPLNAQDASGPFFLSHGASGSGAVAGMSTILQERQIEAVRSEKEIGGRTNLAHMAHSAQFPLTTHEKEYKETSSVSASPLQPGQKPSARAYASAAIVGDKERGRFGLFAAAESSGGQGHAKTIARHMMPLDSDLQANKENALKVAEKEEKHSAEEKKGE